MAKILNASCVGGVVTVEGVPVPGSDILSEGVAASEGAFLMDEDKKIYITGSASDLKATITQLNAIITTLTNTLTLMDAALLTPGAGTSGIASIVSQNATLNTMKENLK